jgi:hypothetical protein
LTIGLASVPVIIIFVPPLTLETEPPPPLLPTTPHARPVEERGSAIRAISSSITIDPVE